MSKKKICFVIYSLGSGGAEKALVNWLRTIDYTKYDVDLQLFSKSGVNLKFLPKDVNVLPSLGELYPEMTSTLKMMFRALKSLNIIAVLDLLGAKIKGVGKNNREKTLLTWRGVSKIIGKNKKQYDVAIGYMHGIPTYYVVDNLNALKKYAWVHNDYDNIERVNYEYGYFKKLNAVYTISEKCVISLKKYFPKLNNIKLIYNINSADDIISESLENIEFPQKDAKLSLLTSGRLTKQKGYDIAIQAAEILRDRGISFVWYILGGGELKLELEKMVHDRRLENEVIFLGVKQNPYPYMKNVDIIVQPSRYEGKSVVLDEAKILKKPIVVTDYNSVRDQITDGYDGMIVPITPKGVADGIIDMQKEKESYILRLDKWFNKYKKSEKKLIEQHEEIFK